MTIFHFLAGENIHHRRHRLFSRAAKADGRGRVRWSFVRLGHGHNLALCAAVGRAEASKPFGMYDANCQQNAEGDRSALRE